MQVLLYGRSHMHFKLDFLGALKVALRSGIKPGGPWRPLLTHVVPVNP